MNREERRRRISNMNTQTKRLGGMRDKQPIKTVLLQDDHSGGPQEVEILPNENAVLFDAGDVEQALKIFDTCCVAPVIQDRRAAMREVMLFALKVAAINLNVHPE